MLHPVKRSDDIHSGKRNGLGGKYEPGKSPDVCVVREVWKESGQEISGHRLQELIMLPAFIGTNWLLFVFTPEKFYRKKKENGEGFLHWIPDTEVESIPLWPSNHIFLPWQWNEESFLTRFVCEGGEYLIHEVKSYLQGQMASPWASTTIYPYALLVGSIIN